MKMKTTPKQSIIALLSILILFLVLKIVQVAVLKDFEPEKPVVDGVIVGTVQDNVIVAMVKDGVPEAAIEKYILVPDDINVKREDQEISDFLLSITRRIDDVSWWVMILATLSCIYIYVSYKMLLSNTDIKFEGVTKGVFNVNERPWINALLIVSILGYLVCVYFQKGTVFWIMEAGNRAKDNYIGIYIVQVIEGIAILIAFRSVYHIAALSYDIYEHIKNSDDEYTPVVIRRLLYAAASSPALIFTIIKAVEAVFARLGNDANWVPELGIAKFLMIFSIWYIPFAPLLILSLFNLLQSSLFAAIGIRLLWPTRRGLSDWKDIKEIKGESDKVSA